MRKQVTTILLLTTTCILACGVLRAGQENETPVNVKSGYMMDPDGRLYYEDAGGGPCIVFLHDGLLHSAIYDPQFAAFAGSHRVVRYDRRGYGQSDPPQGPYSNIADLKAVFDTLAIDSAVLIGCSAGGRLAIDFTLKYPDLVSGLVLIGPVVSGMGYTEHMLTRGGRLTNEIRTDPERYRDFWTESDPYEFHEASSDAKARARELLMAFPQNLDLARDRFRQPPERAAVRSLDEIRVPTLIIVGEADVPDVHAHAGAIEAGIDGARRVVVPLAGHLVALEKPQEVIDLVRSFSIESTFFGLLSERGAATACEAYRQLLTQNPDAQPMSEVRLNNLGYQLLLGGKTDDALVVFKLAVDVYPDSFNVYDSYGEALLASGDTARAVINYERSLELNPDNTNATAVLDRLGVERR